MTAEVAAQCLSRSNVPCVAGTWAALKTFIDRADWPHVEAWARDAAAMGR